MLALPHSRGKRGFRVNLGRRSLDLLRRDKIEYILLNLLIRKTGSLKYFITFRTPHAAFWGVLLVLGKPEEAIESCKRDRRDPYFVY